MTICAWFFRTCFLLKTCWIQEILDIYLHLLYIDVSFSCLKKMEENEPLSLHKMWWPACELKIHGSMTVFHIHEMNSPQCLQYFNFRHIHNQYWSSQSSQLFSDPCRSWWQLKSMIGYVLHRASCHWEKCFQGVKPRLRPVCKITAVVTSTARRSYTLNAFISSPRFSWYSLSFPKPTLEKSVSDIYCIYVYIFMIYIT